MTPSAILLTVCIALFTALFFSFVVYFILLFRKSKKAAALSSTVSLVAERNISIPGKEAPLTVAEPLYRMAKAE